MQIPPQKEKPTAAIVPKVAPEGIALEMGGVPHPYREKSWHFKDALTAQKFAEKIKGYHFFTIGGID